MTILNKLMVTLVMMGCVLLGGTPNLWAQDNWAQPDLDLTLEFLDGGMDQPCEIPQGVTLGTPLEPGQPVALLSQVPGQPFKVTDPAPRSASWWKMPFYAALGFPRDVVDGAVGTLAKIPFISPFIIYPAYELVPTQIFIRDWRDWHRWSGNQNKNGHGYYDGQSWGWFPSYHQWSFSHPSARKLAKYEAYNAQLQDQLTALNKEIEAGNAALERKKADIRQQALTALEQGDGPAALALMASYRQAYGLEEGAFVLWVDALAMGPAGENGWTRDVLFSQLRQAQLSQLELAAGSLEKFLQKFPTRRSLLEAVVYARLLLEDRSDALKAAQTFVAATPGDPDALRLVFELALARRQAPLARSTFDQLSAMQYSSQDWALMQARLALLEGHTDAAAQVFDSLAAGQPGDAYLAYDQGAAQWAMLDPKAPDLTLLTGCVERFEKASLMASHRALQQRSARMLAFLRGMMDKVAQDPEAFLEPRLIIEEK